MHLFTDVCNSADCAVVRSISCEIEDGVQQPQLNVRHRFPGTASSVLSPIGVLSPLKNVKQDQKDRKRDMEKFAKLSMTYTCGVIHQVGPPSFRYQIPRPAPRALVLLHTREFLPCRPWNSRDSMVIVGDGSSSAGWWS